MLKTMARLLLFNPENDIALAHADANFTPTRAVTDFHNAGAALPLWYGDRDGDMVLAPDVDHRWAERMRAEFHLPARLWDGTDAQPELAPWGFSLHALRQYSRCGVNVDMEAWAPRIERIRMLSHRRTAALLLARLRDRLPYPLPAIPAEARSVADVERYATATPCFFMKAPWSSSGRGVVCSKGVPASQLLRQAEGIIRRQGSVMLEPALDKIQDFAALYEADSNGVRHIGFSVFFNANGATAYGGNIVAADHELLNILSRHADAGTIMSTAQTVSVELTRIGVHQAYCGCFGVDMMIYRPDGGGTPLIAPAVEINLRMTMGVVAHTLYEQLLPAESHGIFSVAYAPESVYDTAYVAENGRLIQGTLNLIPPHNGFRIRLSAGDHQAFSSR